MGNVLTIQPLKKKKNGEIKGASAEHNVIMKVLNAWI